MSLLVQKYGGTSVSDESARTYVVRHIREALSSYERLVVVVSAMGRKGAPYATDTLLSLLGEHPREVPARETDLLISCGETISAVVLCRQLLSAGIRATVLTGGQAGIETDNNYGNARIVSVRPERILDRLEQGYVVIVPGFQGVTSDGDITTLGRGGSDTTAVALGAALGAERVDIYTDVDGILTADPRLVEQARRLDRVTYAEISNMAISGAKVIHPRAVEIAKQARLPLRVRSTFGDDEGTLVYDYDRQPGSHGEIADRYVTGIAHVANVTQITVPNPDQRFDMQYQVFRAMAEQAISVDFINVNPSGIVYTVPDDVSTEAEAALRRLGCNPVLLKGCAKVSVIGGGIHGVPGIMARIAGALTREDITILQSADSNATIWVLVRGDQMVQALRALHREFGLDKMANQA